MAFECWAVETRKVDGFNIRNARKQHGGGQMMPAAMR
jgi:hypothetical protein